jgi:hypothetical protein
LLKAVRFAASASPQILTVAPSAADFETQILANTALKRNKTRVPIKIVRNGHADHGYARPHNVIVARQKFGGL